MPTSIPSNKPQLVIDSSTPITQIGLLEAGNWKVFFSLNNHPVADIFAGVSECLTQSNISFDQITRINYCKGPGSTLGLRVAAMAIKTWQSTYAGLPNIQCAPYNSLMLGALIMDQPCTAIAPSAQNLWSSLSYQSKTSLKWSHLTLEELCAQENSIYFLPMRKRPKNFPQSFTALSYDLKNHASIFSQDDLYQLPDIQDSPEATFAAWSGKRHSSSS